MASFANMPLPAGRSAIAGFARDVRQGLLRPQKELPAEYLYDAVGSALFEAITVLSEYGLTRAEERLIRRHAPEIVSLIAGPAALVELGSGSGRKTRPILEAMARRQGCVSYCAIDVSAAALENCARQLSGLPRTGVQTLQRSYLDGLRELAGRRDSGRVLVLFLGSTIGNFKTDEAARFLAEVRDCLRPGDALLLGTDLLQPPERLLLAYDDPAGVTAAFNLNLLARINRELDADFRLSSFCHEARWCSSEHRIEMHLVSMERQTVNIPGAGCQVEFEEGETIWTESSHKFAAGQLPSVAARAGFASAAQWTDAEWPFADNLWIVPEQR